MIASRFGWIVLPGLLLAGCRGGGNNELLERELRLQEDKIYQLHDALDDCHGALQSSRRENETLKKELSGGARGGSEEVPLGIESPSDRRRGRSGEGGFEPPRVEPGPEGPAAEPGRSDRDDEPPTGRRSTKASGASLDQRVNKIVLNKQLTGGLSRDRGREEGILVVFEPQNAAGQLVNIPGDVSVVVLDPAQQGAAARVARWDFSAAESSNFFHKTALGRGFRFELPWPGQAPAKGDLHLFVRLTTADGRKLVADMPLNLSHGDPQARGNWAPATGASGEPARGRAAARGSARRPDSRPERPAWTPFR